MQYKPILLVLSGFGAACLAFTLLGTGDTVTVEKKTFGKGRADVFGSDAERLQIADNRPKLRNAAEEDTGDTAPPKGRKARSTRRRADKVPAGASMVSAGGREGGIASKKQAAMTPEQAEAAAPAGLARHAAEHPVGRDEAQPLGGDDHRAVDRAGELHEQPEVPLGLGRLRGR